MASVIYRVLRVSLGGIAFGLYSGTTCALIIEPGVGVGVEYTDNATLVSVDEQEDTIVTTYVGANVSHDAGTVKSDLSATFNKHNYLQDSFDDQRYLKLIATADWEMIQDRLFWNVRDQFYQRPVIATGSITPDNIQDSNTFSLNAQWFIPVASVSRITIIPEFKKFYYETQATDNKQYSLAVSWNYPLFRSASVGINTSVREVDYERAAISDAQFGSLHFNVTGQRTNSEFEANVGATTVKRDGDESRTGFSGDLRWLLDISSVSMVRAVLSTELTDTSNGGVNTRLDPDDGGLINIQITTDVIRNKVFSLSYLRQDGEISSRIWTDFREVIYSESPNDRKIGVAGIEIDYPVTALLTSGFYTRYTKTRLTQQLRTDEIATVGVNLKYQHSRKLKSSLDIRYQEKQSTSVNRSYTNAAVYYQMVYGFGNVYRRSRSGGI